MRKKQSEPKKFLPGVLNLLRRKDSKILGWQQSSEYYEFLARAFIWLQILSSPGGKMGEGRCIWNQQIKTEQEFCTGKHGFQSCSFHLLDLNKILNFLVNNLQMGLFQGVNKIIIMYIMYLTENGCIKSIAIN